MLENLVMCTTQIAAGALFRMLKCFEVVLNICETSGISEIIET